MQIKALDVDTGWKLVESTFDHDQLVTNGSNFMTGNGYLGYRGTFPGWRADRYVGCVVTNTWDNADGTWKELCTVPNALYLSLRPEQGAPLEVPRREPNSFRRELDFRYGEQRRDVLFEASGSTVRVRDERFASYDNLHLVLHRLVVESSTDCVLGITTGIDSDVWSLHGDHFAFVRPSVDGNELLVECRTQEQEIDLAVAQSLSVTGGQLRWSEAAPEGRSIYRHGELTLGGGAAAEICLIMSVYHSRDTDIPSELALSSAREAAALGFAESRDRHRAQWDELWSASEIAIEGDRYAQALLRYNMYHNFIATPAFSDELPIGARGLSCQAYQGGAFWDQEIFNLPMFLYSQPETARKILHYRWKTLPGARRKAKRLGYRGAFFAWVSADSGDEVCPSYFFTDVLTGRRIRNHFNDWQIHVSPDIAYTVWKYYQSTGDWSFMVECGAELLFEIVRFLASHSYYSWDNDRFEFIRLLGPDEYHENVDNNFFTNYQARYVTRVTLQTLSLLRERNPDRLASLKSDLGVEDRELALWEEMAGKIDVTEPDPHSGIIEQFRGFFELEDIKPQELAKRLQDRSEYWGWPNGIAVETQVSKQADVTQLFALHPKAFSADVMRANYDYYEPRTQHGSSLSYSVYAMVAAWLDDAEEAYRYFLRSLSVDLLNTNKAVSGGTFIGGIHTAACGVSWQIAVHGFAGVFVTDEGLVIEPHLPPQWDAVRFPFVYRNQRATVRISPGRVEVSAAPENSEPFRFWYSGESREVLPGNELALSPS